MGSGGYPGEGHLPGPSLLLFPPGPCTGLFLSSWRVDGQNALGLRLDHILYSQTQPLPGSGPSVQPALPAGTPVTSADSGQPVQERAVQTVVEIDALLLGADTARTPRGHRKDSLPVPSPESRGRQCHLAAAPMALPRGPLQLERDLPYPSALPKAEPLIASHQSWDHEATGL